MNCKSFLGKKSLQLSGRAPCHLLAAIYVCMMFWCTAAAAEPAMPLLPPIQTSGEALKPGTCVETKVKFNLDPEKDYTEDPKCLGCHTTGFGLPGGYVIPRGAKYKVREASKHTEGGTCEVCHGPGSKYGPIHKDVDDRARMYTQEEFYAAGEYRVDERICAKCHNQRNPTAGPDYQFDFKVHKDKDTHENFPLIYRPQDPSAPESNDSQSERSDP
jgi:hypothetical protein